MKLWHVTLSHVTFYCEHLICILNKGMYFVWYHHCRALFRALTILSWGSIIQTNTSVAHDYKKHWLWTLNDLGVTHFVSHLPHAQGKVTIWPFCPGKKKAARGVRCKSGLEHGIPILTRGPFYEGFFHLISNLMEISFGSAIVACAKILLWYENQPWSYTKTYFPSNLNLDEKIIHDIDPWAWLLKFDRN